MNRYLKYIKPYWINFVLAPVLMLVEVACDVQIPLLVAQIINEGVKTGDTMIILSLAKQMLILISFAIVTGVLASYFASKAAVNFSCDLRDDLFKKIQTFSFANIDTYSTSSLITRLTNDITQVQELVVMCLRMFIRAPGMLVGSVVMAFSINPKLALVFILVVPLLGGICYFVIKRSYEKFSFLQIRIDRLNETVREALINVRVIKSLTRESYEEDKFVAVNGELKKTSLQAYGITILQMPLMTLVINLATLAIMYIGGIGVMNNSMDIGDITAFITYLTQILMSTSMLSMIFLQAARAIASAKRISEVLDTQVDLTDEMALAKDKTVQQGNIRFENVSFKYYKDGAETVLSNINLEIKAGQTVGLIGSTGSGKTSLVQLIPRLYDADTGAVYIDEVNVKDYALNHLRDGVAMVLQNNTLFSGTIDENLMWGDKSSTPSQREEAAKFASATFIEELPHKYLTKVDQGGLNLSGGQKQRLCIARALLKKPKILILDDSTSAVDMATEATIQGHLKEDLKEMTKIIIAQRISSVKHADLIVVLNEGEIEQVGTHEQLMLTSKTYQEVYESQMSKEALV